MCDIAQIILIMIDCKHFIGSTYKQKKAENHGCWQPEVLGGTTNMSKYR